MCQADVISAAPPTTAPAIGTTSQQRLSDSVQSSLPLSSSSSHPTEVMGDENGMSPTNQNDHDDKNEGGQHLSGRPQRHNGSFSSMIFHISHLNDYDENNDDDDHCHPFDKVPLDKSLSSKSMTTKKKQVWHERRPSLVASDASWDDDDDDDDSDSDNEDKKRNSTSSSFMLCSVDTLTSLPLDLVMCQLPISSGGGSNHDDDDGGFAERFQLFIQCRHPLEFLGIMSDNPDDHPEHDQSSPTSSSANDNGTQTPPAPPPPNRGGGYHSLSRQCEYCGALSLDQCRPAPGVAPASVMKMTTMITTEDAIPSSSATMTKIGGLVDNDGRGKENNGCNNNSHDAAGTSDCGEDDGDRCETISTSPTVNRLHSSSVSYASSASSTTTTTTMLCQRPPSFFSRRRPPFCRKESTTEWDEYDFEIEENDTNEEKED